MHHMLKIMPNMNSNCSLHLNQSERKKTSIACLFAFNVSLVSIDTVLNWCCVILSMRYRISNFIYQKQPLSPKPSPHPCLLALHLCSLSAMGGIAQLTAVFALQTLYWSSSPLSLPPVRAMAGTCQQGKLCPASSWLGSPCTYTAALLLSDKEREVITESWGEISAAACSVIAVREQESSQPGLSLPIHLL